MRWAHVIFALGVSVCLAGAFIMVAGESVLGESHTGIATVVGIVGIGLIGTSGASGAIIAGERARSLKPKN
jgi:hypothetical protein